MLLRPRLAVRTLVFADQNDSDICLARDISGLADTVLLRFSIRDFNFVFVPGRPALFAGSDLAAFGIEHFYARLNSLLNAIQNADLIPWTGIAAVSSEVHIRRIRPNYGDSLQLLCVQWQKIAVVLEKHDCFLGGLEQVACARNWW